MAEITQGFIADKIGHDGSGNNIIEHPVDVKENEDGKDHYSQQRTNEVPPKFFKMIDERHLCPLNFLPFFQKRYCHAIL